MASDPIPEELQDEIILDLPPREALSIVDPGVFGLLNPFAGRPAAPPPTSEPALLEGQPTE